MARVLGPAATELRAVPPALIRSNRAIRPFALEAVPLLRRDIRPFARAAQPAVAELAQSAPDLAESEPGLQRTFEVLNRFGNMAGYNPAGASPPTRPVVREVPIPLRVGQPSAHELPLMGRRPRAARAS